MPLASNRSRPDEMVNACLRNGQTPIRSRPAGSRACTSRMVGVSGTMTARWSALAAIAASVSVRGRARPGTWPMASISMPWPPRASPATSAWWTWKRAWCWRATRCRRTRRRGHCRHACGHRRKTRLCPGRRSGDTLRAARRRASEAALSRRLTKHPATYHAGNKKGAVLIGTAPFSVSGTNPYCAAAPARAPLASARRKFTLREL